MATNEIVPANDSTVQQFEYLTGPIRIVVHEGDPWFCLNDTLSILGIKQLKPESLMEKGVTTNPVLDARGILQNTKFINEANLYKIIFQSRKKSAQEFTNYVTEVILPTIRKTGMYVAQQPKSTLDVLEMTIKALREQDVKLEGLDNRVKALETKTPDYGPELIPISTWANQNGKLVEYNACKNHSFYSQILMLAVEEKVPRVQRFVGRSKQPIWHYSRDWLDKVIPVMLLHKMQERVSLDDFVGE
jgi:prophage antirepressor-like protein